ncbi:MAG TPA: hypothetical protein VJT73_19725 [Polyangiaceae bacterium]|nr:hypothetical protein [Polyangiaceae bacterium]
MTSSEMNRLAVLYSEIENRLERGETASPELNRLFEEVAQLAQSGEDVWFNLDPKGISDHARLTAQLGVREGAPSSQSVWR